MTENTAMLTEEQAAAVLGLSAVRLRTWRSVGRGPAFVKYGNGMIRYRRDDLDAFVAASIRQPGQGKATKPTPKPRRGKRGSTTTPAPAQAAA